MAWCARQRVARGFLCARPIFELFFSHQLQNREFVPSPGRASGEHTIEAGVWPEMQEQPDIEICASQVTVELITRSRLEIDGGLDLDDEHVVDDQINTVSAEA